VTGTSIISPKKYSLLAAGELLADLVGVDFAPDLHSTETFRRLQGGSPANLAANLARLGHRTALVACVGNDKLGRYLTEEVAGTGVDTSYIVQDDSHPTSLVLVSRTKGTPDFIAYREADSQLGAAHFPDALLSEAAIFHTTCFALSREPARSAIMDAARRAQALGAKVSLDANYAPSLWPDRHEARRCVARYVEGGLVKLSDDDAHRLFGRAVDLEDVLSYFHEQNVELVCYTLGAAGSVISWDKGARREHFPVETVEVKDATGAGDAYWSGFLSALTRGFAPEVCALAGARMAARKISTVGPLPARLDTDFLYGE
jgi:sugar/nucleoside kinase (ribokinase family)